MRKFDYSFLRGSDIPVSIANKMVYIASLKESVSSLRTDHVKTFAELEDKAKFLSVKGSNAIEGIATSDERLSSLMDRSVEPIGHDEQEIAGYRDALVSIHSGYSEMTLDEETILGLHRTLMSYTNREGGIYKTSDNVIMEIDKDGNRRAHFRPLSSKETPEAMDQFILSFIDAHQSGTNPLLLIPCFILDFLSIHPFIDGNGRMSRLLTLLLLYKAGFDVGKYISVEERVDMTKDRYYSALSHSSEGWHEGRNDYIPFIDYFLDVLLTCYRGLDRCFATIEGKKATKNNRIEAVVMNSLVPISKREIMSMLPDVSQTTVELCLHRMLDKDIIEKIGSNRGARYRRKY